MEIDKYNRKSKNYFRNRVPLQIIAIYEVKEKLFVTPNLAGRSLFSDIPVETHRLVGPTKYCILSSLRSLFDRIISFRK
jgi:hypothetical protein